MKNIVIGLLTGFVVGAMLAEADTGTRQLAKKGRQAIQHKMAELAED
ncbi:MAG: hypothetical protein ACI4S9_06775 [Christensenellales bacterium]